MNRVYKKANFNVYQMDGGKGYIVHNFKYPFHDHHTHIKNYKTCIFIIDLVIHKSMPHHLNSYLLKSLIRLSDADDKEYRRKINQLLEAKADKAEQQYYNPQKGVRRKTR